MTRVDIPTSVARQRRIKQSHGVDPQWGAPYLCRQAGRPVWSGGDEMCGRLPRVPRIAASDHSASRQTPEQEAAGRESGNHVPFPATSSDSMTLCASRYSPCRRTKRGLEHDNRYSDMFPQTNVAHCCKSVWGTSGQGHPSTWSLGYFEPGWMLCLSAYQGRSRSGFLGVWGVHLQP